MKAAVSALLLALLVQDPVCDHGSRGTTRPVDLKEVARIHEEVARAFDSFSFLRPTSISLPSLEPGLPSCRSNNVRRVRVEPLPAELKSLYFGTGEPPTDAIHVVTADPELVARFGLRCAPTVVRRVSETEVELTEGVR